MGLFGFDNYSPFSMQKKDNQKQQNHTTKQYITTNYR